MKKDPGDARRRTHTKRRLIRLSSRRLTAVLGRVLMPVRLLPVAGLAIVKAALLRTAQWFIVGVDFAGALCVGLLRRLARNRRAQMQPQPTSPPIEHVAADLRRLLWQHDRVRRDVVEVPAKRLWALESAITRRAIQAAGALRVPHPDPPVHRGLDRSQLNLLLCALAAEGLMLPPDVGLMVPDRRR